MQRTLFVIAMGAVLGLAASITWAAAPQDGASPSREEIHQTALRNGPATPRIGYVTHPDPAVAPGAKRAPADIATLKPLTDREVGMLYGACIAYQECKVAYAKAYERHQELLRAQREQSAGSGNPR